MLEAFLAFEYAGVAELRAGPYGAVTGTCGCGCGAVHLQTVGDQLPRSAGASPVSITGDVRDAEGSLAGGVTLVVCDGLLSSLEV